MHVVCYTPVGREENDMGQLRSDSIFAGMGSAGVIFMAAIREAEVGLYNG